MADKSVVMLSKLTKVLKKVKEKFNKLISLIQDCFARTKYGKRIIKVTTFIIIIWFYLQAFLCPQIREFAKQRTTIATTFDDAGTVNMPNLVICTDPVFKPSVVNSTFQNKYYSMEDLLADENSSYLTEDGKTLWEVFEALTYDFDEDFHLYHNYISDGKLTSFTKLKYGSNINANHNSSFVTKMSKIATYRHGMCSLLQPQYQESRGHQFLLQFTQSMIDSEDRPNKFEIYFASPNSWHGVIDDDWLYFDPMRVEFLVHDKGDELSTENWVFKTVVSELRYRSGNQNMSQCQHDEFLKANCTPKCFPLKYNFMYHSFPPCNTYEEALCMINQFYYNTEYENDISTCLKPLNAIQYKVDPYILAVDSTVRDTFKMTFSFPLNTMKIEEEIEVISLADFIGYTGGALSLFIGFSCFDYFSRFLDKVYQRCHSGKYNLFGTSSSEIQKV